MKLWSSSVSPYVRKVSATIVHHSLQSQIEICNTKAADPNAPHNKDNPLGRIPALRSRAVFGESALRSRFEQIRQTTLALPRDNQKLRTEVREMREKMYEHLSGHDKNHFNIKKDRGGITDIEFIAQYLVLAYAPRQPQLAKWSDNVRIFEVMAESAVISQQISVKLKDCYTALRNKIHHLNLLGLPPVVPAEEFAEERKFIQQIWQNLLQ